MNYFWQKKLQAREMKEHQMHVQVKKVIPYPKVRLQT
jgi:hypothetical protein